MIGRLSAHLGYMFTEYALRERFAAAAEAGFTAVEHPGPYALPARELRRLLKDNGLELTQIALPAGDAARGEKGVACLPEREADFETWLEQGLDYAIEVGCGMVHLMGGIRPPGHSRADLRPIYLERLAGAAEAARACGITLLIEPIGVATIADYFLDDPYEAVRAVDEAGGGNTRLLFDAFHATNAGVDAAGFVAEYGDYIAHVHIADHPGRHEPGTGVFDFERFFAVLDAVGYDGRIGLEYIPAGDTRAGLSWLEDYPV